MRKIIIVLTIIVISVQVYGQGINNVQNIVPQTPEANAILKFFETPVSLYTGSPDISIPVHNIKEGDINFDLKLSYNSTGITVGERASWVGLGWNLSIPTLVRNVRQIPDDFSYGFFYETKYTVNNVYNITKYLTPDTPINNDCLQCGEIDNLYKSKLLDLESDDYRLTLPDGKSISFMVNQERDIQHPFGHFVQFPGSDYKIEYVSGNWEITNPQGYKYLYTKGNTMHYSYVYTIGGDALGLIPEKKDQPYTSTWVLSKITSPGNHILNFEYDPIVYEDCDLVNQTKTVWYDETAFPSEARNNVYSNYSKTKGTNLFINRIWGDFGEVVFNKDGRLDYTGYGKKLSSIEIKNKAGLVNKVAFDFDYMTSISPSPKYTCNRVENDNDISKRLMLKKIRFNTNDQQPITYQFNYNSLALPNRLSYARDWWGYYNGQDNNMGLTPSIDVQLTEQNNRDVRPSFAKAGSLEEIVYPTGGKTKFQFESNRGIFYDYNNATMQKIHDIIPFKINNYLFSTHQNGTQLLNKIYETQVPINVNELTTSGMQIIELNTSTTKCIYPENTLPYINSCSIYYSILDNSNNIIVPRSLLLDGYSKTLEVPRNKLLNGVKIKMEVYAGKIGNETQYFNYLQDEATMNLSYKVIDATLATNTSYGTEIPFGGLRIKRIENYENIQNPIIKEYDYTSNGIETGISLFELDFLQTIPGKLFVTSQSRFPTQTGNGYLISYTNAKEYRINPATNERNNISQQFENNYLLGSYIGSCFFNVGTGGGLTSASVPCYEDPRNGRLLFADYSGKKTESFDYQDILLAGKNLNLVYGMDYDRVIKPKDFNYIGLGAVNPTFLGAHFFYYKFKNFDDADYSKVTKEIFNGQELTTKVQYYSLNSNHHQVTKEITTFPDTTSSETNYQYAHEKGNQLMIDKNMIGIPLETSSVQTVNGIAKTTSRSQSIYPVNQGEADTRASGFVLPLSALSYDLQTGIPSTEITYDKYDSKGNIIQYTTKDGISTSIIWGYNKTQPIAKIEGAKLSDITQSLIDNIVSASDNDGQTGTDASEQSLISALDSFRNSAALSGYQITTYSYDPLIGVRSITPPSGIRELYKYDVSNRLEKVVDANGKVLKEYQYHYKN